jgi:hypothetical protein
MNINRALILIINTNGALILSKITNVELVMNTNSINVYYEHFQGYQHKLQSVMGH